jgi:hypothetical protein
MGIRKSYGKNKKSNRPTEAATVEREGILRQASKARGRPVRSQAGAMKLPAVKRSMREERT